MSTMRTILCFLAVFASAVGASRSVASTDPVEEPLKVLILTGSNNHDWQATTEALQRMFASRQDFAVDVELNPERLTADILAEYDVLLSNWNAFGRKNQAAPWPQSFKDAYADFVRQGGGHVAVHAGSSAHYDWPDYQAIGLANWSIVNPKTWHGPVHAFETRIVDTEHVVVAGMSGFQTHDELWQRPYVHPDAHVLVEAYSKKTDSWVPSVFTGQFGEGRCFTILLGHSAATMQKGSFEQILLRGTAWAGHHSLQDSGGASSI